MTNNIALANSTDTDIHIIPDVAEAPRDFACAMVAGRVWGQKTIGQTSLLSFSRDAGAPTGNHSAPGRTGPTGLPLARTRLRKDGHPGKTMAFATRSRAVSRCPQAMDDR